MLGIDFVKVPPTSFVLEVRGGKVRRAGAGLSFFYFAPVSTIVIVPLGSRDVPFIFTETTSDFQTVTVQGSLTYRVAEPRRVADILDFSVRNGAYVTEDPAKLALRVVQAAQTTTRAEVQARTLRETLGSVVEITRLVHTALAADGALGAPGLELLDLSILALRPVPDTARALEAEARERLLREADDAIYIRRNNAVEQERRIRENELRTELAVEAKQREIEEAKLARATGLEEGRQELVRLQAENVRTQATAQSFAVRAQLEPLKELDARALQVLATGSADPRLLVAMAFQEIAANAGKIGTLNVSPDLLESLLQRDRD